MNTPWNFLRRFSSGGRAITMRAIGMFLMLASLAVVGCGDDPAQPSPSFEVRGLALRIGTVDTVVVDTTSMRGSLRMETGATLGPIDVQFIKKDGTRGVPGAEYTLAWSIADPSIVSIESVAAWQFRIQGKKQGTTETTFRLMKDGNAVYTSPSIPVTVGRSVFTVGDTLVYDFYDRDMDNQRVASSRQQKTWHVLRSNIQYEGKTGVTEILEVTTTGGGSVETGRDTIYIQMAQNGEVHQYDMLRMLLTRADGAAEVLGTALQPQWILIGNTQMQTSASWNALNADSVEVKNITLPGVPTALNMAFRMNASHKGQENLTVPAGAYTVLRTDHKVSIVVRPAAIPIPILSDSVGARFAITSAEGIVASIFESKVMEAMLLGQTQQLPIIGFEMELVAYKPAN